MLEQWEAKCYERAKRYIKEVLKKDKKDRGSSRTSVLEQNRGPTNKGYGEDGLRAEDDYLFNEAKGVRYWW